MDKYLKEKGWKCEIYKRKSLGRTLTSWYYTKGTCAITRFKVGKTDVWSIYSHWVKEKHYGTCHIYGATVEDIKRIA